MGWNAAWQAVSNRPWEIEEGPILILEPVYLESFLLNLNARRVLRSGHQPWEDTMEDTMELRDIEGLGQSNRNDEVGSHMYIIMPTVSDIFKARTCTANPLREQQICKNHMARIVRAIR